MSELLLNTEYQAFLSDIKRHYKSAQLKAVYTVNHEMIQFYWHLGLKILEGQTNLQIPAQAVRELPFYFAVKPHEANLTCPT